MPEQSPFPFRVPTVQDTVDSIANPPSYNKVAYANKFQGRVLKKLTTPTLGDRVHSLIKYFFSDEDVSTAHIEEVIVRVEDIHSHLDPNDIDRHKPAVAAFEDQDVVEGCIVEVVYENRYTGTGGVVLRVVNRVTDSRNPDGPPTTGGKGQGRAIPSKSPPGSKKGPFTKSYAHSKSRRPRYWSEFPKGAVGIKNTVLPPPPKDSPFEVGFTGPRKKLRYVRQETVKRFQKIAEAAGWFYCAVDKAEILVYSAAVGRRIGERIPSFNHGEGYALDYTIKIDGRKLNPAECWAFTCALCAQGIVDQGGFGAYINNKKKWAITASWQRSSPTHYDTRRKATMWVQLGDGTKYKSAGSVVANIMTKNPLGLPQDLVTRAKAINKVLIPSMDGSKLIWKNCKSNKDKYRNATKSLNRGKRL